MKSVVIVLLILVPMLSMIQGLLFVYAELRSLLLKSSQLLCNCSYKLLLYFQEKVTRYASSLIHYSTTQFSLKKVTSKILLATFNHRNTIESTIKVNCLLTRLSNNNK